MPCFRGTPPPPRTQESVLAVGACLPSDSAGFDALCAKAITHLRGMKAAKPGKTRTLTSTVQTKLGKDVPATTVGRVCSELVKRGIVKVSGTAVTYALPPP